MNPPSFPARRGNWAAVAFFGCIASLQLHAQVTSFSFQGQLTANGAPATGSYDLRFSLFSTNINGSPLTNPLTNSTVSVNNGLFTTLLDFGANVFDGTPRWLEIGVRTNGSLASYVTLSPRQFISASPYAISAVKISGPFQSTVAFSADPPFTVTSTNKVSNFNADLLDGLDSSAFLPAKGGTITGALTNNSGPNTDAVFTEGSIDRPATNAQVFAITNSSSGSMTLQVKNELRTGAGSATNPSHSFLANTNTGLFNPLANVLAFATAGTERLRISTNGNVGIGTIPGNTARLEVAGNTSINGLLSLSTTIVSPGIGSTISPVTSVLLLNPSTAVTLDATTPIAGGVSAGTLLILVGTSDVNTVSVPDSGNVHLSGTRVLGDGDTLTLIFSVIIWSEMGYDNN